MTLDVRDFEPVFGDAVARIVDHIDATALETMERIVGTLIVDDVATLGAGYVACDPRDLSEIVVPCFDDDGRAWITNNGLPITNGFDLAVYIKGDRKPTALYNAKLVIEFEGTEPPPPPEPPPPLLPPPL